MGLKWLFITIFSVLRHPETFWHGSRERFREVSVMRDYAAPVIAIAQFSKLPFVTVPRMAMLLAIVSFIVDVAVLYLLSGAINGIVPSASRSEEVQNDSMMVLCFSLTPVWLAEPFCFLGMVRWAVIGAALAYTLVLSNYGMHAMPGIVRFVDDSFFRKAGFLVVMAVMLSFMLVNSLIRFFTSF
jgi:hypothetical protein